MHVHLLLYSTRSLWDLTPWICIFRSIYILSYWPGIWRESQVSWGAKVLLLDHPFSVFLTFLYSYRFHDSVHWTQYLLYSFIHLLLCVDIYMYCCSDYYVIIVDLYSLFRLLYTCIRGVFSSHIYVADSRRDSVSTYSGKRSVTYLQLIFLDQWSKVTENAFKEIGHEHNRRERNNLNKLFYSPSWKIFQLTTVI